MVLIGNLCKHIMDHEVTLLKHPKAQKKLLTSEVVRALCKCVGVLEYVRLIERRSRKCRFSCVRVGPLVSV